MTSPAPSPAPFEVMLGFDMETDVGSFTPFHEGLRHATPKIVRLFEHHGITGTFYYVGRSAREVPQSVEVVKEAGFEVGAHSLFHETVGEPLFPIPGDLPLLPHEVLPRLELNTQWIAEITGEAPRSFRCPRLFGSNAVCHALEQLGYVSDATYPVYRFRERLEPYHPHVDDWRQPGAMRLVEIPNFADIARPSEDELGRDADQWPKFRTESAEALLAAVDRYLALLSERGVARRVLSFYFHPWEFHPMPQGEICFGESCVRPAPFIVKNCGEVALEELDRLITGLKARGGRFQTAQAIAAETPPTSVSA